MKSEQIYKYTGSSRLTLAEVVKEARRGEFFFFEWNGWVYAVPQRGAQDDALPLREVVKKEPASK